MGADYVVDFLLGTKDLKQMLESGKSNVGGGGGMSPAAAAGGLKVVGVLALLGVVTQLKAVQETMSFLMTTLSTGLVFLISMFVQWIVPFFKDPVRFLLSLFVDQANMIITVLEFMTNAILGALTLGQVGGFGDNQIEFPRFQKDIILSAYDNMTEVINSSEDGIGEVAVSIMDFTNSFVDSFITNTEYAQLIEDSASTNFGKVVTSIDKTGGLADDINSAYERAKKKILGLFNDNDSNTFRVTSPTLSASEKTESTIDVMKRYNVNKNF